MSVLIPIAIIVLIVLGIYVYRKYYVIDLSNYDGDNNNLVTYTNPMFRDPKDVDVNEEFDNVNSKKQNYFDNPYFETETMA